VEDEVDKDNDGNRGQDEKKSGDGAAAGDGGLRVGASAGHLIFFRLQNDGYIGLNAGLRRKHLIDANGERCVHIAVHGCL